MRNKHLVVPSQIREPLHHNGNSSIVFLYHIFLVLSFVDGRLSCFHVLATINSAAMNIGAHVSFEIMVFSGYMSSSSKREVYSNTSLPQETKISNNLTLHLKQLEKEEQKKLKVSRRTDIIKIRAEIYAAEMKKQLRRSGKLKAGSLKRSTKFINP